MSKNWGWAALVGLGVVVLGLVLKSIPLAVLGGAAGVVALLFGSAQKAQESANPRLRYELSHEVRLEIKPMEDLRRQIEELVRQNDDIPAVKVIGNEALADAEGMIEQAIRLLTNRSKLRKMLYGKAGAARSLADLEQQRSEASDPQVIDSLDQAIRSRQLEIQSYSQVESALASLESKLSEAEAALASLKATLASGAASLRMQHSEPDALAELARRLKSLGTSFEEANASLEQQMPESNRTL